MADTRVTVPFNRRYLPGENTTYSKISISAVVPGSATIIATDKNHGLFGNLDLVTVYDNGTNPFINFIEYPATVIDGKRFSIPVDTTKFISLCSNGYIVKRSSFVGPVRKKQDYDEVALSVTPALDKYIIIEKEKNDFGIQTEVDISMLGIPREETTTTQIEEVTKYDLNSVIWQTRSWNTFGPIGDNGSWHREGNIMQRPEVENLVTTKYSPERAPNYFRGTGKGFVGAESCYEMYTEIPAESRPYFLGPTVEPYYPGLYPAGFAYHMLETQRSFKYLPGRANVFTFGVKAVVDNAYSISDDDILNAYSLGGTVLYEQPPGNITRWGVGNASDAYYFELSGNGAQGKDSEVAFSVNRRRHYRGNSTYTVKKWSVETDYNGVQSPGDTLGLYPDDPFYCVSPEVTKSTAVDPDAPELTKVFQKDFKVDTVDGKGPSGSVLDLSKVTMYKIEFSWYGAAGARFFAYLNNSYDKAEWVCLHEIEGGQIFKEPVLNSPVMQIKYMVFGRAGSRISLKKYGVSCYIEGANEGTMVQNTRYTDILKTVSKEPVPLVGISTTDVIRSSFGENIPNSKIVLPSLVNVTASDNCLVEVVWKPSSNLIQGVTKGAELRPVQIAHPPISATLLTNTSEVSTNNYALSGAYNLRALSGNFGISGPAAKQALIGARIYDSKQNTDYGYFKNRSWNPFKNGGQGDWELDPLGTVDGSQIPGPNALDVPGYYTVPRPRTAIFNTYIADVGDFNPNKPWWEWFKTCEKGDVIWLTRPLSSSINMNLGTTNAVPVGQEVGITGPYQVYPGQYAQGPGNGEPIVHAFTSVYPYVTGATLAFNLELLDRQAISNEVFVGKDRYWCTCNLGSSHEGKLVGQYGALDPNCEGYLGRYFLRNYVEELNNLNNGTAGLGNNLVGVRTALPHLLRNGEVITYNHASTTFQTNQLALANQRQIAYTVLSSVSADYFIVQQNNAQARPVGNSIVAVSFEKIYIVKNEIPDYIPLSNINFYPYPYVGFGIQLSGMVTRPTSFPKYNLPIDRVSLTEYGGPTLQIYPRGVRGTVDPIFNIFAFNPTRRTRFKEFQYYSNFAVATAAYTQMTIGFPQPYSKVLDNIQEWPEDVPRGDRGLGENREDGEPWRLVFVGNKGASIRDAIIISDYYTPDQQTVSVTWTPLSSVRFAPRDYLTGRMLSGVPGLSCVYPEGSDALRQPPNFVTPKDMYGTAAKLDFQSSQPLYYKNFIPTVNSDAFSQMAPRTIAAFYVPKGKVLQYDISQYFGLVAEYLSNTLKKKEIQPWNTIYVTARTLASAAPNINDFNPNNFAAAGYNQNYQFGLFNEQNNTNDNQDKYRFTELYGNNNTMAAGDRHVIVLGSGQSAKIIGNNTYGQLGLDTSITLLSTYRPLVGKFINAVCGNNNTFLLSANGIWLAAGDNTYGQLGLGTTGLVTTFTPISNGFTIIVPGSSHTFAKDYDGVWWMTGDNSYGQLGTGGGSGFTTFQPLYTFLTARSLTAFKDVACGNNHTILISAGPSVSVPIAEGITLSSFNIWGCGANTDGQLGLSDNTDKNAPAKIGTGNWTKVVARGNHTLALSSNYRACALYATGNNQYGQLGLNSYTNYNELQQVLIVNKDLDAIAGVTHTAILCGTSLFTAGDNTYGQLGLSAENDIVSVLYPGYDASISLTVNKDNNFMLEPGQPLPLSGSAIYCETRGPSISAYLSQDATYVKRLVLPPSYPYPTAKVYAGLTWREQ